MIKRVSLNHEKFKNPEFINGLNILAVEQADSSTNKQTRNSSGKSSLVQIISFIFGSDVEKNSFFVNDIFKELFFSAELEYEGFSFTVSRSGKLKSKVFLDKKITDELDFDLQLEWDNDFKLYFVSVSEWKHALGKYLFNIPQIEKSDFKYKPTFRSIFSYFVRKDLAGGLMEPKKNARQQQTWDEQVNLSFILGLDWGISCEYQTLRDKEKAIKELKKSLKEGYFDFFASSANLRSQIAVLEGKIKTEKEAFDNFDLLPEYKEYENELASINIKIKNLINQNYMDKELLNSLNTSIDNDKEPNYTTIEQLYQETTKVFPDTIKRRFEEVLAFNSSIIKNRKLYLESERRRVERAIQIRDKEIQEATSRQYYIMNLLETHGALEQYNKLNTDLVAKQAQVETLKEKLHTISEIEDSKPHLDMERAQLLLRLGQNIEENSFLINEAIQRFEEISSTLYDEAGMFTIEKTSNGVVFDVKKQGDKSKGIKAMQIYCFDMMLMTLLCEKGINMDFLVHDSHIFDPVDSRQVAHAIVTGEKLAKKYGFQYIVTLNSDQIPRDDLPEDFNVDDFIIPPHLTDMDNGGLFGFRF